MALEPDEGWYFQSLEEAEEWLDFDENPDEQERRSYAQNDTFEEWVKWRAEFFRTQP